MGTFCARFIRQPGIVCCTSLSIILDYIKRYCLLFSVILAQDGLLVTARTDSTDNGFKKNFYLYKLNASSGELNKEATDTAVYTTNYADVCAAVFDYKNKILYTAEFFSGRIVTFQPFTFSQTGNLDTLTIHAGVSHQFMKIAFDWVSNNLYWADERFGWIIIQALDKQNVFKVLLHENIQRPLGIAVDPKNK